MLQLVDLRQMGEPLVIWHVPEDKSSQVDVERSTSSLIQNEEATELLLQKPEYNGKKVVIVCISGPSRWGKSFLLNHLLQYLRASGRSDWAPTSDEPLRGFPWGKSSKPVTRGIQIWSEPFLVRLANGEQAVLLIMDTEGAFDMEASFAQCSKLSALSAYISSMLIYNLQGRFHQNFLTYLRYFADYGRTATGTGSSESALCQQLTFLIRDWVNDDEYMYGWDGGEQYLAHHMKISPGASEELNEIKTNLPQTFSRLNCFLMRHPDSFVITNINFTGQSNQMPQDFVRDLRNFVLTYLSATNLQVKCFHGQEVLWDNLPDLFRSVTNAFNRSDLPDPESLFAMSMRLRTKLILDSCLAIYSSHMNQVNYSTNQGLHPRRFEEEHNEALRMAVENLRAQLSDRNFQRAEQSLKENIEKCSKAYYENFRLQYGRFVVDSATEKYAHHMNQVDYFMYEDLESRHFDEEHNRGVQKAREHLHDNLRDEEHERWERVLHDLIDRCSQSYRETFQNHLRTAWEKHNEHHCRECVDDFIVNLPLRSANFDPLSATVEVFKERLRGDQAMKVNFEVDLTKKLEEVKTYYDQHRPKDYFTRYDFFQLWKAKATREQNLMATFMRTRVWNQINCDTQLTQLQKLIAFVLYGDVNFDENEDRNELVDNVISVLRNYGRLERDGLMLRFAIIFVYGMNEDCLHTAVYPVFRIMKGDGRSARDSYFLDHCGRVYNNWKAYLVENLLNGYWLLAPTDGEYLTERNSQAKLTLNDQRKRNLIWKHVDISMGIGGVASAAVVLGSVVAGFLFPPSAILTVTSIVASSGCVISGAYHSARCAFKLLDKKLHGEDMSSREAIAQWVMLAFNVGLTVTLGAFTVFSSLRALRMLSFADELLAVTVGGTVKGVVNITASSVRERRWSRKRCQQATALLLLLTNYSVSEDYEGLDQLYTDIMGAYSKSDQNPTREFVRDLGYL